MFEDRMDAAYQAWQAGNHEQAASILRSAVASARRAADNGTPGALAWLVALTDRLDTVLDEHSGDPAERLRIWAALASAARGLDEPIAELGATVPLVRLHFEAGNIDTAVRHGRSVIALIPRCEGGELDGGEIVVGVPGREELYGVLIGIASSLYYEHEKYPETAELAAGLVQLLPDQPSGWFLLGYAALRQDDFEQAIEGLTEVTRLQPDRAGPYAGLAIAYHDTDRFPEAISAISRAIELDPDQLQHRYSRAQLLHIAGRLEEALAELDVLIEQAEEQAEDDTSDTATSDVEYERNMPMRDLADIAGLTRLQVLSDLGRYGEAMDRARRMTEVGDPPTAGAGHGFLAQLHSDAGNHHEAVRHYTAQLDLRMHPVNALLGRALSYRKLGRIDDAVDDLDALTGQAEDQDPEAAARALEELVERNPGHLRARKVLAHAYLERWHPAKAAALLTELLDQLPDDWEVRAWLGLAQVTFGDVSDEAEERWNNEISHSRVMDGVFHLVDAVRVAGGDERPKALLRWLVERACALPELFGMMVTMHFFGKHVERDGGLMLTDALPELAGPFEKVELATRHEGQKGEWHLAIAELLVARAALADADLPVLAAQIDLKLADNYLRLFEVQKAIDHVDAAEQALPVLSQLPPNVEGRRDIGEITEAPRERGRQVLLIDFDHLWFNSAATNTMRRMIDVLRSQAIHRTGDTEGALAALGEGGSDDFQELYHRAILLRDTGKTDEAAELLPRLEELAGEEQRLRLANLEVTIHLHRGETDRATAILRDALADIPADSYGAAVLTTNIAQAYLQTDRVREVLEVFDQYPLPLDAPQMLVHRRHFMRGQAQSALEEWPEALKSYQAALALSEGFRGSLRAEQARMTWQEQQQFVYRHAIFSAVMAEDAVAALELVERSKSRAFLDQLGISSLEPSGDTSRLRENWERARKRQALLTTLARSADPNAEVELLHRLAELGSDFTGPTEDYTVEQELAAETAAVERLAQQFSAAYVEGLESVAGPTLSYAEIRQELPPGCLLAEFYVSEELTLLFLMTEDAEEPEMVAWEMGGAEVTDAVGYFVGGLVQRMDPEEFAEFAGSLVEPIIENTEPGDVVVLVPHGPLHYVPLHTALVDRNPVCRLPSASLLRYRKQHDARDWSNALVLGDSREDLVHSRQEARSVAARFGTHAFLGHEASRERFTRDAPSANLVHLACHGRFDAERALSSAVLLADEDLTVEDTFGLRLSANLVTLSACESGVSETRPGDELIGLTRAVLHAGVPSLVVSLWEVDDLSTSLLMDHFYAQVRAGVGLAEALRVAQLRLAGISVQDVVEHCERELAGADPFTTASLQLDKAGALAFGGDIAGAIEACRAAIGDHPLRAKATRLLNLLTLKADAAPTIDRAAQPFAHPFYWAAFVLVGDWR